MSKIKNIKKIKYALIGCGRIAPEHIKAALHNDFDIIAICDISSNHMDELLAGFNDPRLKRVKRYNNYLQMISKNKLDLVSIATPSGCHARIAIKCIEAGINTIIEKPIALSLVDADQIIWLSSQKNIKVAACHQNRYNSAVQRMHSAVESGKFGKLSHGAVNVRWNRKKDYYASGSWRGTWEDDGGALMNQCIHGIDLLRWILGNDIEKVYGTIGNRLHECIETEDVGTAIVHFRNGVIGTIEGTVNVYPDNLEETICLFGEEGTAKLGGLAANCIEVWEFSNKEIIDNRNKCFNEEIKDLYGNGHEKLYADMKEAISNDRRPYVDAFDGRNAIELVLAIYKSQKEGKAVSLPLEKYATLDMLGIFKENKVDRKG